MRDSPLPGECTADLCGPGAGAAQEFVGVLAGLGAQPYRVGLSVRADAVCLRLSVLADGLGFLRGIVQGLSHRGAQALSGWPGPALPEFDVAPAASPFVRPFGVGVAIPPGRLR